MKNIKLLLLGDVMGPDAASYVGSKLWGIRKNLGVDFVVANCENCASGNGVDKENARKLLDGGCDLLTTGNHVFKKPEARILLEDMGELIRPANYPPQVPGRGHAIVDTGAFSVLVINVLGTVMMEPLSNPIFTIEKILAEEKGKYDISVLDIHAETTSEKLAVAHRFDGVIDVVVGTHTHVQTADEQLLPNGTAYITDLGMCGPIHSVLGVRPECIIEKLTTNMPVRFALSDNKIEAHGALVTLGEGKKPISIERITF